MSVLNARGYLYLVSAVLAVILAGLAIDEAMTRKWGPVDAALILFAVWAVNWAIKRMGWIERWRTLEKK